MSFASSSSSSGILKIFFFVLAAVAPVIAIALTAYFVVRRKRRRKMENNNHQNNTNAKKKNKKKSKDNDASVNLVKMDTSPILAKRASISSYSSHHGRYHNVYSSPGSSAERTYSPDGPYDGFNTLPSRRAQDSVAYSRSYDDRCRVLSSPQSHHYATVRYSSPQPSPEIRLSQDRRFVQSTHSISADV